MKRFLEEEIICCIDTGKHLENKTKIGFTASKACNAFERHFYNELPAKCRPVIVVESND
jgi:hypothetical protein